jgi:hypothetical protein
MAEEIVEAVVEIAGEVFIAGVSEAGKGKSGCRWRAIFLTLGIVVLITAGAYWLFS